MDIFLFVAVFAALVGAGIGWLFRGRVVLTAALCIAAALLAQFLIILYGGPQIEHLTVHYLIGYAIYMVGPFLLFYLFPCVAAGVTTSLLARRVCEKS